MSSVKSCVAVAVLIVAAAWVQAKPPRNVKLATGGGNRTRSVNQVYKLAAGYVVEIIGRESDDGNRVRILRDGRAVRQMGGPEWVSLGSSCFFLPAVSGEEPLIKKPDQDITGDGVPDLVIREYAGGVRKMVTDHVFGLAAKGLVVYEPISYGYADPNARYFVKGRGRSLDVEMPDWSLAPLFSKMFDTPTPTVRLAFYDDGEKARWAFANPPRKLTPAQKADLLKHAASLAQAKNGPMGERAFGQLVEVVANLIYCGNADMCREYVESAFRGRDKERLAFLIELAKVLDDSGMADRLLAMNECNTWSELLCGKKGLLRTDCACDETGYWAQQECDEEPDAAAQADAKQAH